MTKLVKGTVDLGCESSTITFARMEQVAFSHMIFVDGGSLLATVASGVERVRDLSGKRVGVIPHTTTEKTLAAALGRDSIQAHIVSVSEQRGGAPCPGSRAAGRLRFRSRPAERAPGQSRPARQAQAEP
jgi:ABC-type amino acid transport substrate-binding protein